MAKTKRVGPNEVDPITEANTPASEDVTPEGAVDDLRRALRRWQRADNLNEAVSAVLDGEQEPPILKMPVVVGTELHEFEFDIATWSGSDRRAFCDVLLANTEAEWKNSLLLLARAAEDAAGLYE